METLIRYRQDTGRNVVLALEIHADHFTPSEYFYFVEQMAKANEGKLPIAYDLDTGHLAEAIAKHRADTDSTVLALMEDVFKDERAGMVAMISINQFSGGPGAHERPTEGVVDIPKVVYEYGKAAREESKLSYPPYVIPEFYPQELSWYLSEEGLLFCRELASNFAGQRS